MQKAWYRCQSDRRMSQSQLGMTGTYSIAQQDHPYCCIHLVEHRCSKTEFLFYKISTGDHNCLCHTSKCWINLFSFKHLSLWQKRLSSNSPPPAWVAFHTWWVKIYRQRAVLVWSSPVSVCFRAEVQSGQRVWTGRRHSLITLTLLWPVINILHVSLEWNQGQESCFLPKLKKYIETWCAESNNASWHLFAQQTGTGWSKGAPGILAGCYPSCHCVSWGDLSLDHNKVHTARDLLLFSGRKQPKATSAELALGGM